MSRIGNKPIEIPAGVTINVKDGEVSVKGPKGTISKAFPDMIKMIIEGNIMTFERPDELPFTRAMHGTTRALIANMVTGVTKGFSKTLDLVGVGYRVAAKGKGLTLSLGFSHPIEIEPVDGINFKVEGNNKLIIEGIRKEVVGQVAAEIRAHRPPEPYKGKGVKYSDEIVRRKEGKKA